MSNPFQSGFTARPAPASAFGSPGAFTKPSGSAKPAFPAAKSVFGAPGASSPFAAPQPAFRPAAAQQSAFAAPQASAFSGVKSGLAPAYIAPRIELPREKKDKRKKNREAKDSTVKKERGLEKKGREKTLDRLVDKDAAAARPKERQRPRDRAGDAPPTADPAGDEREQQRARLRARLKGNLASTGYVPPLPVFSGAPFVRAPGSHVSDDRSVLNALPKPLTAVVCSVDTYDAQNQAALRQIEQQYLQGQKSLQGAYEQMSEMREAERHEMERRQLVDSSAVRKNLGDAIAFVGSCREMCPVFERVRRAHEKNVLSFEKNARGQVVRELAVKAFSRPAAGQPPPLPSDVRPPEVLVQTLNYLVANIVPKLPAAHPFLWDRTRSVRQDFTYQNYQGPEAVHCLEVIARVHVVSLHVMAQAQAEQAADWSQQQELEQFNKCLQSLADFYTHARSPNEPEMRAYQLLLQFFDPEMASTVDRLRGEVRTHPLVLLAFDLRHSAAVSVPVFFARLRQPDVPPSFRAVAEVHFNALRKQAIRALVHSVHKRAQMYSMDRFVAMLGFESAAEARAFCNFYDVLLSVSDGAGEEVDIRSWDESNIADKLPMPQGYDKSVTAGVLALNVLDSVSAPSGSNAALPLEPGPVRVPTEGVAIQPALAQPQSLPTAAPAFTAVPAAQPVQPVAAPTTFKLGAGFGRGSSVGSSAGLGAGAPQAIFKPSAPNAPTTPVLSAKPGAAAPVARPQPAMLAASKPSVGFSFPSAAAPNGSLNPGPAAAPPQPSQPAAASLFSAPLAPSSAAVASFSSPAAVPESTVSDAAGPVRPTDGSLARAQAQEERRAAALRRETELRQQKRDEFVSGVSSIIAQHLMEQVSSALASDILTAEAARRKQVSDAAAAKAKEAAEAQERRRQMERENAANLEKYQAGIKRAMASREQSLYGESYMSYQPASESDSADDEPEPVLLEKLVPALRTAFSYGVARVQLCLSPDDPQRALLVGLYGRIEIDDGHFFVITREECDAALLGLGARSRAPVQRQLAEYSVSAVQDAIGKLAETFAQWKTSLFLKSLPAKRLKLRSTTPSSESPSMMSVDVSTVSDTSTTSSESFLKARLRKLIADANSL